MDLIVIGKPAVNIYLPLQEFPQEGDIFTIRGKNESVGNVGATSACLLSKWGGNKVHFTGVVGNDLYAEKIRNTFSEYKVNTKFIETVYDKGTSVNYIILNAKSGMSSKILYNDPDNQLTKYKYDFQPAWAILDGTDLAGTHALLNNDGKVKTVFYARIGDKDTVAISKRCTWVVCTQNFAESMTRFKADDSAEGYVELYQKLVDSAGTSNYLVILKNHKILYCVDGKVKMLPEMKMNQADVSSFDSVFTASYAFAVMNNVDIDSAVKFANTAAGISISKIGEVPSIPTLDEVLDNSGLRDVVTVAVKKTNGMSSTTETTTVTETQPIAAEPVAPLNPQVQTAFGGTPQPEQPATPVANTQPEQPATPVVNTQPQDTNMFDTPNV